VLSKDSKIMVVDDMFSMRNLVKQSLEELGYSNLSEAQDGQEAWNKIKLTLDVGNVYGLIICDWNMPIMQGIDLLRKVRSVNKLKSLPFILLTGEGDKENVTEAIQAGVSTYLLKPVSTAKLKDKIEVALRTEKEKSAA